MKKTVLSAFLAIGLSMSASAVSQTFTAKDAAVTTTYVWDTKTTDTLTATQTGVLSGSNTGSKWQESTVTFTLDYDKIAKANLADGFYSLVSIINSANETVGLGVTVTTTDEGVQTKSYTMQWGDGAWASGAITMPDSLSGKFSIIMGYGIADHSTRPATILYDSGATNEEGESAPVLIFGANGLGMTSGSNRYVTEVSVNSDYVYQFAVSNATLKLDSTGIGVIGQHIPEPATATLSLLALAGLAARRRRK